MHLLMLELYYQGILHHVLQNGEGHLQHHLAVTRQSLECQYRTRKRERHNTKTASAELNPGPFNGQYCNARLGFLGLE